MGDDTGILSCFVCGCNRTDETITKINSSNIIYKEVSRPSAKKTKITKKPGITKKSETAWYDKIAGWLSKNSKKWIAGLRILIFISIFLGIVMECIAAGSFQTSYEHLCTNILSLHLLQRLSACQSAFVLNFTSLKDNLLIFIRAFHGMTDLNMEISDKKGLWKSNLDSFSQYLPLSIDQMKYSIQKWGNEIWLNFLRCLHT
jgi:hypothetical protein